MCDSDENLFDMQDVRRRTLEQLQPVALVDDCGGDARCGEDAKDAIRQRHKQQRLTRSAREVAAIGTKIPLLMNHFANGCEVLPRAISPQLEVVHSDTEAADVFRLATLLWSIPVSKGFGRRMRYLVRDEQNGKVIGLFSIGDPVFNLRTREEWIGWTVAQRIERLAHVMDAYIVGAVPPYSQLLGGKLVASLIASEEVRRDFERKYEGKKGIISATEKPAHLALVTVTSALGRSSVYNRLKLGNLVELKRIGYTQGWGHFQVTDALFDELRAVLEQLGHPYANGHQFGHGPNWKLRTIRAALRALDLDPNILRHGIRREVFAMPLCREVQSFLRGEVDYQPITSPAADIAAAAKERWVVPRAERTPSFRRWTREQTRDSLLEITSRQVELALSSTR